MVYSSQLSISMHLSQYESAYVPHLYIGIKFFCSFDVIARAVRRKLFSTPVTVLYQASYRVLEYSTYT